MQVGRVARKAESREHSPRLPQHQSAHQTAAPTATAPASADKCHPPASRAARETAGQVKAWSARRLPCWRRRRCQRAHWSRSSAVRCTARGSRGEGSASVLRAIGQHAGQAATGGPPQPTAQISRVHSNARPLITLSSSLTCAMCSFSSGSICSSLLVRLGPPLAAAPALPAAAAAPEAPLLPGESWSVGDGSVTFVYTVVTGLALPLGDPGE